MKRYFNLYKIFLRFSFLNFTVFRANFINSMVSTVGWGVFQFAWINLLTIRTQSAFGWNKHELVILAILYIIIIGVFHFLFSRNFERFSRIIDRGELDFILLKPVDSQFMITNFMQGYPNLIRIGLGIILLVFYLHINNISISFVGLLGFLVFIVFGIMLLYSLWLSYCTLLIWFPQLTNILDFLYTINGMSRYPLEMMREVKSFLLLFIFPFSIAIATPAKVLVRGTLDGDVYWLIFLSVILFFTSRTFWNYALRFYTSASS